MLHLKGFVMVKKTGIYILLCALSLWVSPGIGAAVCAEVVALIDHDHHAHTHSAEEGDHDHSPDANHGDADDCCTKIFANGAVAILPVSSSVKLGSSHTTAVWSGSPVLYPHHILYPSKFLSSVFLEAPPPNPQVSRFILFSTFLI